VAVLLFSQWRLHAHLDGYSFRWNCTLVVIFGGALSPDIDKIIFLAENLPEIYF
jgi:hypothetical protein